MAEQSTLDEGDLELLAERVADRLRHLSPSRLEPLQHQVRPLVDALASLALQAEGVPERRLGATSSRAFGDQVDVLAHDLVRALRRQPSAELAQRAGEVLMRLRAVLP